MKFVQKCPPSRRPLPIIRPIGTLCFRATLPPLLSPPCPLPLGGVSHFVSLRGIWYLSKRERERGAWQQNNNFPFDQKTISTIHSASALRRTKKRETVWSAAASHAFVTRPPLSPHKLIVINCPSLLNPPLTLSSWSTCRHSLHGARRTTCPLHRACAHRWCSKCLKKSTACPIRSGEQIIFAIAKLL